MAFLVLNDLDVIFGQFYLNVFIRSCNEGKKYVVSEEFLKFKFKESEQIAGFIWIMVFSLGWLFLFALSTI
jgi:hypothetical protein